MFDANLRRWNEFAAGPLNGNLQLATAGYTGSFPPMFGTAPNCDVLTFSLLNAFQAANSQPTNVNTGDILYYTGDGTFFVVTQVAATTGGAYPITAMQMNNMVVNGSTGACITNNISDPTLTGATTVIHAAGTNYNDVVPIGAGTPGNIIIPSNVFFGDFIAGSTTVQNISTNGPAAAASNLATFVNPGDVAWGYFNTNDPTLNWPYTSGMTKFATVTNGTPGTATLSSAPLLTGRYPLLPLPVVGLGQNRQILLPLTVALLPACNATLRGMRGFVTDQNTAVAYKGAVTGGGSTNQAVQCDGAAWYQD
jgi:hypothetical protein